MNLLRHILFVLSMCFGIIASAHRFETYTTADGLPGSTVKCVTQDGQGYIWIGTFDGLARYDGYGFRIFRHEEHPISDFATCDFATFYFLQAMTTIAKMSNAITVKVISPFLPVVEE